MLYICMNFWYFYRHWFYAMAIPFNRHLMCSFENPFLHIQLPERLESAVYLTPARKQMF